LVQHQLVDDLTEKIEQTSQYNAELNSRLQEVQRLYEGEQDYVHDLLAHIEDHVRMHP